LLERAVLEERILGEGFREPSQANAGVARTSADVVENVPALKLEFYIDVEKPRESCVLKSPDDWKELCRRIRLVLGKDKVYSNNARFHVLHSIHVANAGRDDEPYQGVDLHFTVGL
jgi:hypothetical protein